MKINKQKLTATLLVSILIVLIPLVAAAPSGTSESAVVEAAKSWIGVKSVHGGDNKSGIDCSHLVFQVYKQAGAKDIVFQTVPNMKKNSYYVNTTSPTPGDVIFWKKDITKNNRNYWLVNHVGIYIGNEQFIDTSFDTKVVAIESVSGVYKDGMPYYARWDSGSGNNNNSNLPVAAFSISPASGKAPLNVTFTDQSTGATSLSWNFGDGNTSAEKNPTHTYSEAGNYTAILTVNNENGSNSKSLYIIVQGEPSQEIILPVADFNANTTSGSAPLSVQFTDLSENSIGRGWDFNNDWQGDSGDAAPIYMFTEPGSYNVNFVAINENGTSTKTITITVLKESSSDGSSGGSHSHKSGSSNGGIGGSPEPAKNVKVKELAQVFITSEKPIKFEFPKNATCIVNLSFDSKKTVGKITTIVEMLKNKSILTKETPEGEVYKYLNIWVGNGGYGSDEDNLENAVINFKVEKSWLEEKGVEKSSIVLNRYSDKKWNVLQTTFFSEDDKYLYFKAETPGFSPFAITSKKAEKQTDVKVQPESEDKEENNRSTAGNVEVQSENKDNISTPDKVASTPDFKIAYGIACLSGMFLYRRQKV